MNRLNSVENFCIKKMIDMFNQVNVDCIESGEEVVPLSNVGFYSNQIAIIYNIDEQQAQKLAEQIAHYVNTSNYGC